MLQNKLLPLRIRLPIRQTLQNLHTINTILRTPNTKMSRPLCFGVPVFDLREGREHEEDVLSALRGFDAAREEALAWNSRK